MDAERARVGVDGVSGRRDAAADGDGGQLAWPTAASWSSRASSARSIATIAATRVEPKVVRRTISADTAATLTGIMEGVVGDDHGTAKTARIPGYTIAGKTGTAAKLVNGRYSTSEYNASFVGFLPSRDPVGRDHRRHRLAPHLPESPAARVGARLQADRRSDAPVSRRAPQRRSRAAGSRGPRRSGAADGARATRLPECRAAPMVSLVADEPPGTVPDLRGLSAREATHTARHARIDRPDVGRRLRRVTGSAAGDAARVA